MSRPRPGFLRLAALACGWLCLTALSGAAAPARAPARPNIVFILADDLGVLPDGGEMRPSLQAGDVTVAAILKRAGYVTGCIGKWGQGDEGTPGLPWLQGFDRFFGFLHNTHGTRYYTEFIYRNAEKIALPGNFGHSRKQYAPIAPGRTTDYLSAFGDFLPTACDLAGAAPPAGIDGISYLPTLLGRTQPEHDHLYWELAKRDEPQVVPKQAVRRGQWILIRNGDQPLELYNLMEDPLEQHGVASAHADIVNDLAGLLATARTDTPEFPLQAGPGFE